MVGKFYFNSSNIFHYSEELDILFNSIIIFSFGIVILYNEYSITNLIPIFIISTFSFITSLIIDDYSIFFTAIIILGVSNYDFLKFMKLLLYSGILLVSIHSFLSLFYSILSNPDPFLSINGDRVRYNLGFEHPNIISILISNLVYIYVTLHIEKRTIKTVTISSIVIFIVYFLTDTRTLVINYFILLFLFWISQFKSGKFTIQKITKFIIPINSLLIYFAIKGYLSGNSFALLIDKILNGRIKLGAYGYTRSGFSLFPQNIPYFGAVEPGPIWQTNWFTLDNVYSFMLLNLGIIWIFIISIIFYKLSNRIGVKWQILLIAWAFYGFTEVHGLNGIFLFPILLSSKLLVKNVNSVFSSYSTPLNDYTK